MDEATIKRMREMLAIQGSHGNWNLDPYMQGMYNGMEFMMALAEGRDPVFKEAPDQWIADIPPEQTNPDIWRKLSQAQEHKPRKDQK